MSTSFQRLRHRLQVRSYEKQRRDLARKRADRRYRENPDGSFVGPFKGAAFGRGATPTQPPLKIPLPR